MTRYGARVIGSTDVYSRKHIDREVDRWSRLHDVNKQKIRDLKGRLDRLEGLIPAWLLDGLQEPVLEDEEAG